MAEVRNKRDPRTSSNSASGRGELQKHIKESYSRNVDRDEFKSAVPSCRLRGKEFDSAASGKIKSKTKSGVRAPATIDTADAGKVPLLEMFYFNRIIVDEFHQLDNRDLAAITSLKTDKIWGLSGTPAYGDFYEVAQMAKLLGIPLRYGSDSRGIMKMKNIKKSRKEISKFEIFENFRRHPLSDAINMQIYEQHQRFLDDFVRRDVSDLGNRTYQDHLRPVELDLDHQVLYTELSQHLNSSEMRMKRGKVEDNPHRQQLFNDAAKISETAEEALSKAAAYFEHDNDL